MAWTKAIERNKIDDTQREVISLEGKKVLIFQHKDKLHAVQASCPHLSLPLTKGQITEDNAIVCPFHKSAFDIESGDVKDWSPWPPLLGKALACLSRKKALQVFATKVEEDAIWVDI